MSLHDSVEQIVKYIKKGLFFYITIDSHTVYIFSRFNILNFEWISATSLLINSQYDPLETIYWVLSIYIYFTLSIDPPNGKDKVSSLYLGKAIGISHRS